MTEPTMSERADALASRVKAACGPYRRRAQVPASMAEVLELAELVRNLARTAEQKPASAMASILLEHQGPFFNGTESQCSCGLWVKSAEDWSEHVAELIGGQGE